MAQLLKQSTAITIMFGPFVAVADGSTLLTDATTITDIDHATTGIFLSKAGAAAAIRSQAVTASVADAYGMMKVTLSTTDTGTVGMLDVLFAKASRYLPVHKSFMVVPANIFDSLVAGTDLVDVSVTQLGGVAQSLTDLKDFADDGYDPSTNKVQGVVLVDTTTTTTTATNLTNLPAAAATAAELAKVPKSDGTASWNATALAALQSEANDAIVAAALATAAEVAKIPKSDGTVSWNTTALAAIQTQAEDALVVHRLDELLNADSDIDGAAPPTVGSVFHELMTKTAGSFTYDQTTDSLEANRDNVGTSVGASISVDVAAVKTETASIQTDTNDIQTRLPSALTANGNMKSSLVEILTTALTETLGQLAAGFKQFFNIGSPTSTMNLITAVTTTTNLTNLPAAAATAGELAKVPKSDGAVTFNVTCVGDIKSGLSTQAELNKVPKSDGTTTWNATALGDIQTQAEDALVVHRLDELLNADSDIDGAAPPTVGSVFHELMTKAPGSFTYDQATDSLEALRDRGDTAWITAAGFSTFDPTTDPVLLADGAHGGVNATIAAKSISVINSANNGVAVNIQGTGTGNSHGINLSSANGKALAIGAAGNAVTIDSSAASGLVVNGATGDIVGDITGTLQRVTLCDTTTTNTDMRGTDSAALAVNLNNGTITLHTDYDAAKSAASQTSVNDIPTNAELATALGTADDAVLIAINDLPTNAELATALGTADDAVLAQIALVKAVTDQLAVSVKTIVEGTCAAGGNVTTIIASTLSPATAVNDQLNGRVLIFTEDTTTTALRGQATAITGFDHATQTITVTALTTAPAAGDIFAVL